MKYILIALILISVLVVSGCTTGGVTDDSTKFVCPDKSLVDNPDLCTSSITTLISTTSIDEIAQAKSQAKIIPYDELFRNNEKYIGDIVYFRGKIIQVLDDSDNYNLRVDVTNNGYFWEDTIYVFYSGKRLLEDDIIYLWGRVNGLMTYESIFGQSITIPEITALHIELENEILNTDKENNNTNFEASAEFDILDIEWRWSTYGNDGYISSFDYLLENTGDIEIEPIAHIRLTYNGNIIYEDDKDFYDTLKPTETSADDVYLGKSIKKTGWYMIEINVLHGEVVLVSASETFEVHG